MKLQLVLILIIFNSWLLGQVVPISYDQFLCNDDLYKTQMICLNERMSEAAFQENPLAANSPLGLAYGENNCIYSDPLPSYDNTTNIYSGGGGTFGGNPCNTGVCCGNPGDPYDDNFHNRESYYYHTLECANKPNMVAITKVDDFCWSVVYLDTGVFLFNINSIIRPGRDINSGGSPGYCGDTTWFYPCGQTRVWKQISTIISATYSCNRYENPDCNLVSNGGFEEKAGCPSATGNDFFLLNSWEKTGNVSFFSLCGANVGTRPYYRAPNQYGSMYNDAGYPPQPLPSKEGIIYFKTGTPGVQQFVDLCENQKYEFSFYSVRGNVGGMSNVELLGINSATLPATGGTTIATVAPNNSYYFWNQYSTIFTCPANFNMAAIRATLGYMDNISIIPIDTVILDIQLLSNSCDSGEMTLTIPGCYGPYDVDLVVEGDTINLTQIQDGHVVTIPIVSANTTVEVLSITNSMGCITVLNETDNFVVNNVEDASFTSNDFCEGQSNTITFLGDTGVFSLVNNTTAATINPSTGIISGAIAPNTYIIRHDVCLDFALDTIQVIKNDASFTSTNICVGGVNTVNITGTTGGVFSILPPVNGATINSSTGELSNVSVGDNYTVQYKVGTICPDSSTQIVQAVDIENPSFTTSDFCVNAANVISISGVPGGTFSFSPTPSDTATINSTTGVISGASVGASYTIKYVTPGTCKDSTARTVNVLGLPTATISGAGGDLCVNDSLPLTINLTGIPPWNVNYTDGSNVFSVSGITSSPITVYAKTSGDYQVVFVKDLQCSNIGDTTSSVTITGDSITFWSNFTEGCEPQEIKLWSNVSGLAGDCFWDFGDGGTQNLCDTVYHTYQNAGTYSVKLTVSSVGCNADTIMDNLITIHENPVASYYYNPSAPSIVYNRIKLTNTSIDNITNQWFLDSAIVSSIAEPEITLPSEIGSNLLCLVVENIYGCYDTSCVEVFVSDESLVYVPNAFVPDNNGLNDVFKPIISNVVEYDFKIFNRWGQVVFNTKEINKGWDGTFLGAKCPIGVYNYRIVYKYKGDIHDRYYRGHVNLLR